MAEETVTKPDEGWHTVKELAAKYKCSTAWISHLCSKGRIKATQPLGGAWRISDEEYKRILTEGLPPLRQKKPLPTGEPIKVPKEIADLIKPLKKEAGEKGKEGRPFPWSLFE